MTLDRQATWSHLRRSTPPMLALLAIAAWVHAQIPQHEFALMHSSLWAIGGIGCVRYGWMLANHLRAALWLRWVFPALRRRVELLPEGVRFPKRLYVVVPSYREDPRITERVVLALLNEIATIPSSTTLVFNVGGDAEVAAIRALVSKHTPHPLELIFMLQAHGKRLALGQCLRTVAREFHHPLRHHAHSQHDVVALMDGDTELQPGALRDCLGFFQLDPRLGALTTDEVADFLTPQPVMAQWFQFKFLRRHVLMSSHALSGRVLTLTGRFSLFRAEAVLTQPFIEALEHDHLAHWACGRFRFLMGDDKSTWYQLLKSQWRMIYVPDCQIRSVESRSGNFLHISSGLMYRWFGNMVRNNGRALALGPHKMPLFIWVALWDQRIALFTTLLGPACAIIATLFITPYSPAIYLVWVLLTRLLYLVMLMPHGGEVRWSSVPLLLYDQWVGSLLKLKATLFPYRQSWSKGNASEQAVHALSGLRLGLVYYRAAVIVGWFGLIVLSTVGVAGTPSQWAHNLAARARLTPSPHTAATATRLDSHAHTRPDITQPSPSAWCTSTPEWRLNNYPLHTRLKRRIDVLSDGSPRARAQVHTEGLLPANPERIAGLEARKDFALMHDLAALWLLTRQPDTLAPLVSLLTAWAEVYQPSYNPVDETHLEAYLDAYAVLRDAQTFALPAVATRLVRQLGEGYLQRMETPADPQNTTWRNNWQSHRIKIATLAAVALQDSAMLRRAEAQFVQQLSRNIAVDGTVFDFLERDALHYVAYDLEPLLRAAIAARTQGRDWLALRGENNSALMRAVQWLQPYATGQRQHEEFANTTIQFDRDRRASGVRGFEGMWNPQRGATLYWLASVLDPSQATLAATLAPPSPWARACWDVQHRQDTAQSSNSE
nr:glycosyltransferase [uncultured Rhodoferax sp.]